MNKNTIIRKLVDYSLLNAYSVNSSGFYNGKIGISLALFEAARYLNDDYIESQAFELLQEALLCKSEDISFENGLSGIGYVLIYLIENKFIDADFWELFAEKHKKIVDKLKILRKRQDENDLLRSFTVICYLDILNKCGVENENEYLMNYLSYEVSQLLVKRFLSIKENRNIYPKIDVLKIFQLYLKVGYYCSNFNITIEVLNNYFDLYNQNKLASSIFIGYYLSSLEKKVKLEKNETVGIRNREIAISNINPDILTFSEKLDLLNLFYRDRKNNLCGIKQIESNFLEFENIELFEKKIVQSVYPSDFIAGYQSGIARFLLFCIFQNTNRNGLFNFV